MSGDISNIKQQDKTQNMFKMQRFSAALTVTAPLNVLFGFHLGFQDCCVLWWIHKKYQMH